MGLIRLAHLQKGIHEKGMITKVDIKDRKGKNGIINKMVYITLAKLGKSGKPVAEAEVAWWKPDPTSDYFKTNLQEMCLQLHNVLACYMGEEEAFAAFKGVFEDLGITDQAEIELRKWKQTDVNKLVKALSEAFLKAITPYIKSKDKLVRFKLTTNHKGEGTEIPKYGIWMEPDSEEETKLFFTDSELKTHSKGGITSVQSAASSLNVSATL